MVGVLFYNSFAILVKIIDFIILIRVLLSWVPIDRDNPIVRIIYNLSEPLLYPFRELLRKSPLGDGMMIDFSPFLLILFLQLIQNILASILF